METAYFRPVNDFRSPAPRAPRCRPEVDDDDVIDGSATLLDENEEWAKVSNELCFYFENCILLARAEAFGDPYYQSTCLSLCRPA